LRAINVKICAAQPRGVKHLPPGYAFGFPAPFRLLHTLYPLWGRFLDANCLHRTYRLAAPHKRMVPPELPVARPRCTAAPPRGRRWPTSSVNPAPSPAFLPADARPATAIRNFMPANPAARLIFTGCYAIFSEKLAALPGVLRGRTAIPTSPQIPDLNPRRSTQLCFRLTQNRQSIFPCRPRFRELLFFLRRPRGTRKDFLFSFRICHGIPTPHCRFLRTRPLRSIPLHWLPAAAGCARFPAARF